MQIAFFDSGIGGLTVLEESIKKMPYESYIYFADTDNVPYGTKSNEEIKKLVFESIDFVSKHNLKALVIACNTATSVVVKGLREKYTFPIVGMEPAIKPAIENTNKKVLLCATERTLKEQKLHDLIESLNAQARVKMMSLQELVMFAEYFDFNNHKLINYLESKFSKINWDEFDSIVLGCTHFLFFKEIIKNIIPNNVKIIDGNQGTVNRLETMIEKNNHANNHEILYYSSQLKLPPIYFDHYLRLAKEQS